MDVSFPMGSAESTWGAAVGSAKPPNDGPLRAICLSQTKRHCANMSNVCACMPEPTNTRALPYSDKAWGSLGQTCGGVDRDSADSYYSCSGRRRFGPNIGQVGPRLTKHGLESTTAVCCDCWQNGLEAAETSSAIDCDSHRTLETEAMNSLPNSWPCRRLAAQRDVGET